MKKQIIVPILTIVGILICTIAFGDQPNSNSKHQRRGNYHQQKIDVRESKLNDKDMQHNAGPPPQAYEDCKGKKAGDIVQHTTPEGVVEATCEDSPEGLVARPNQPPPNNN